MVSPLFSALKDLNRIKSLAAAAGRALRLVRALLLALVTMSLWAIVRPQEEVEQLALGLLVLVLAALLGRGQRHQRIEASSLILALEMKHPKAAYAAARLKDAEPSEAVVAEWQPLLQGEIEELKRYEKSRLTALASSLLLPLLLSFAALPNAAPSLRLALDGVTQAVARLNRGATLKIVQGGANEGSDKPIPLISGKTVEVELLAQNLLEVTVTNAGKVAPIVELRKPQEQTSSDMNLSANTGRAVLYQSFQMAPLREGAESQSDVTNYGISFAASEPVELYIPAIDGSQPLAMIKVKQLPIPKVKLALTHELEDPWPDDRPLNLKIDVEAKNPLQTVRLIIRSGQRSSKELVANVMAEDRVELSTEYKLMLEPYVESDLAQVEITAEAIDRALPAPLIGVSAPLRINTASAYGRYRQALASLRELKQRLDEAIEKQLRDLPEEAYGLASKAVDRSERSPFFDGLDRVQLHRFEAAMAAIKGAPTQEKFFEISQALNEFLFEHEILDDRERDRDFFVAARALSRAIEQEKKKRPVSLPTIISRMQNFLNDRQKQWERRVGRLPENFKPKEWPVILGKKPFHAAMANIEALDTKPPAEATAEQLKVLSKTVVDYRSWIEELEAKEDAAREQEEQERQEGLASARNVLRELQLRQGEISQDLDRADTKQQGELNDQWPSTRMKQNTNVKETRRLEGQMRSLSPNAGQRIQAAIEAMEGAIKNGNEKSYTVAESASDLAGRLLRQAESAAQQSQQKRKSRGRRRQVTGDNYYGQSVVGGDVEIKREYQVDRRYREDILEEVQHSGVTDENKSLLENYLRQVIR